MASPKSLPVRGKRKGRARGRGLFASSLHSPSSTGKTSIFQIYNEANKLSPRSFSILFLSDIYDRGPESPAGSPKKKELEPYETGEEGNGRVLILICSRLGKQSIKAGLSL